MKKVIAGLVLHLGCSLITQAAAQSVSLAHQAAATLFPLSDVRLTAGPFLEAQNTDLRYLMALDPDRLLAPFQREAGLPAKQESYGNWESSGLDGHMGGHYLSALALMAASTGDAQVSERLNYFVAELKKCQQKNADGYLGGIPDGKAAWQAIRQGQLQADNFSVNGKWVPWYNLHKLFAGLRDAYRYAGNQEARGMLLALSDWALNLTANLSPEQMQLMLKSEHGGMNEVLADVAQMTGDHRYLELAKRFSHQAILDPLLAQRDQLTGLHANAQIPKVIGFQRIAELSGQASWHQAAEFFWQTVHDHRTVAIGGNSVKEHFHDDRDFSSMINEVEGPETCNTYNMLKLTELLFLSDTKVKYSDYYERALYNHILSSQRPESGGLVYFTPMRPNHYRVYSQVDQAMWCCVGSGIESHAKYGEFIYAHYDDVLYVNLFIPSTLYWRDKQVRLSQSTNFPDQASSAITIHTDQAFTLKIRYPQWVVAGALKIRINNHKIKVLARPGDYVSLSRHWRAGDRIDIGLPMTIRLEAMPGMKNYYAVLHGPIVLAAKTQVFANESLNFMADDSRMGHIAQGQVCPLEAAPMLVSDSLNFIKKFKPVAGQPLTFTAPGLIRGQGAAALRLIPFFRLHDARYTIYWPYSTPANLGRIQQGMAQSGAERLALDAQTIDQLAPGEQQPESDHFFKGDGADAGINQGWHWRHATGWFSYELSDAQLQAKTLRLYFSTLDAGRHFDLIINGRLIRSIRLEAHAASEIYSQDFDLPEDLVKASGGKLNVKFVAQPGSIAGALYGLRLLK
ncbi:glycoside hydrolase family 127 protein [Undibacterium sp. Jales W-56]|uniref:glycoside hydrolase family 127 protein n=1 Tax=Undibacterium sp. Jales W-56 TaxID=2897325 RepID=UPI0021D0BC13|nr:glycoside hydrolase family 127 protein [Undibacterium sp. Jales W-56]MCU6432591.1 glycoside hydrolase family 127 protein [Undibacterium sp. Jales W-56]